MHAEVDTVFDTQWRNQSKRATWSTDQQHQCHIECFINLRAGQPGQSKVQPGHCQQLPRCSYANVDTYHRKKLLKDAQPVYG